LACTTNLLGGIDFYGNIGFGLNFLASWTVDIIQFSHSLLDLSLKKNKK
jgi:hypothetical protein